MSGRFGLRPIALDADFDDAKHPRGQPGNAGQFASGGSTGASKAKKGSEAAKAPKGKHAKTIKAVEDFVREKLSPADFAELQRIMSKAGEPQAKTPKDRTLTPRAKALHDELEAAVGGTTGDKFWSVFERVKALPVGEVINLAKAFTGGLYKTKSDALHKIAYRQRSLEGELAKKRVTGGRSAA